MKKYLVLCPLAAELDFLLAPLREQGLTFRTLKAGPLEVFESSELGLRFGLAGHGKTQFGIQTQFLISYFGDVKGVVCAGCAGGLAPEVAVFDVALAKKTIEHDYRLKFVKRPDPEFPGDAGLLQKFSSIPTNFKIHTGVIASGDEDVIDEQRAAELREQTGALAVAWEGVGGARAAKFNSLPFIEVRGITDTASSTAPIDFEINLKEAMKNVSALLIQALVDVP